MHSSIVEAEETQRTVSSCSAESLKISKLKES